MAQPVREFRALAFFVCENEIMFDDLSSKFGDIFDRLRGRGALSEEDVATALREIRVALLEADVSLSVVKQFIDVVREEAVGQAVLRSVTPGQMVVKIVHDQLVKMLGPEDATINFDAWCPVRRPTRSIFSPVRGLLAQVQ